MAAVAVCACNRETYHGASAEPARHGGSVNAFSIFHVIPFVGEVFFMENMPMGGRTLLSLFGARQTICRQKQQQKREFSNLVSCVARKVLFVFVVLQWNRKKETFDNLPVPNGMDTQLPIENSCVRETRSGMKMNDGPSGMTHVVKIIPFWLVW